MPIRWPTMLQTGVSSEGGPDEADEQDRGRGLVGEDPARDVGDPGEHGPDGQRLDQERGEQQPEVAGARDDAQLLAQAPGAGRDGADGCRARAQVGADHTDHQQHGDRHPHRPVAGAAAQGIPDHRRGGAAEHDREREDGDPPRHQPGAFVVGVGDLRRHRDVGHLEERVGGGAGHEEHQHPQGVEHLGAQVGSGEQQREEDGEEQAALEQEGATGSAHVGRSVADPPGDRVQHHVPGLGDEHDDRGDGSGDAEGVGQVGEEHQARHGAEGPGRHGSESVAHTHPARKGGPGAVRGARRRSHGCNLDLLTRIR